MDFKMERQGTKVARNVIEEMEKGKKIKWNSPELWKRINEEMDTRVKGGKERKKKHAGLSCKKKEQSEKFPFFIIKISWITFNVMSLHWVKGIE